MNDPLPPDDPRLTYVGQSKTEIDYAFYDLPGGATVILIDATSGAHLESGSFAAYSGGSGKNSYSIVGTPSGTYYLAALSAAGDATIAQTVRFTIGDG